MTAYTIVPHSRAYNKAFSINLYKYKGACQKCRQTINFGDIIISKSSSKNTKYYHEKCARKVMILDE
jgi:hypothetical protein